MEPIPETLEAISELMPYLDEDRNLLELLEQSTVLAQRIAPDLAGISIGSRDRGVTFTLVATTTEIAALDGVQYLTSGPCVEVSENGQGVTTTAEDLLNEPRWHALSQATAAAGIRSTLTFPILRHGQVNGTVNLYGLSDHTFDGKHEALAAVFQAWAPGAVMNADLSFSTRRVAQQAPEKLQEQAVIDFATGLLSMTLDVTVGEAREHLEEAARRAGISVTKLAESIKSLHTDSR